jgi:thiol-disulfide isomerase/thioredoxin
MTGTSLARRPAGGKPGTRCKKRGMTSTDATTSQDRLRLGAGLALFAAIVALVAVRAADLLVAQPRELARARVAAFDVTPADVAAPPVQLATLDGKRFDLAEFKGQVVFLNFWATWCPPCRQEMPSMIALGKELAAKYPGRFKMVAVSVDEGPNPIHEFFAAPPYGGVEHAGVTIALDPDQKVTQAYYCTARGKCPDLKFPESYIVDGRGRLVSYVVGPRDWSVPAAREFLESLLKG